MSRGRMKNIKNMIVTSGILLITSTISLCAQGSNSSEVQYSGTLIALPCTVDPMYENFGVDFGGNINAKDLINDQRRYSKEDVMFHLTECDTSLGNTISAKFSGLSVTANGLLNVDASSEAKGIAVGLETPSGIALPINNTQTESVIAIKNGDMTIRLRSYVQAVDGVSVDEIVPGFFSATLTYSLLYQ